MSTGGSTATTSTNTTATPGFQAYANQSYPYLQQGMASLPVSQFTTSNPAQTAGLSPTQQLVSSQIPNLFSQGQVDPSSYNALGGDSANSAALAQLAQLVNPTSSGNSAATNAAMQNFQNLTLPQIQNSLATMGLGRSGAGAEIESQAQTQALAPLLQQQIANQSTGVNQLTNMGTSQANQQNQAATIGQAQGTTEQNTAQAPLTAAQNDYTRLQTLATQLAMPEGSPVGQPNSSSTTQPLTSILGK
jgi:hypothetical protein